MPTPQVLAPIRSLLANPGTRRTLPGASKTAYFGAVDFFGSGALPIGMLMFAITVGGALRKKAGHLVAKSQYPRLALDLGLEHRKSRYASGVGQLVGTLDGLRVTVDPDDQRSVRVSFTHPPGVELWMHSHNRRPPPSMRSFRPERSALSALFRTAHGTEEGIARLNAAADLDEVAEQLRKMRGLKSLSVTETGVTAVFDFGSPPYIPEGVVRQVLPGLVRLAKTFGEPMVSLSPQAP